MLPADVQLVDWGEQLLRSTDGCRDGRHARPAGTSFDVLVDEPTVGRRRRRRGCTSPGSATACRNVRSSSTVGGSIMRAPGAVRTCCSAHACAALHAVPEPERAAGDGPADQAVDHPVLAEVDERGQHHHGEQEHERLQPLRPDPRQEERRHDERERGVQRRHRCHAVAVV